MVSFPAKIHPTVLFLAFCVALSTAQMHLLPTNRQEFQQTVDDISYSVNKLTNPEFKVNSVFWDRLLKTLEAPSVPQPSEVPSANPTGNAIGTAGKLMMNIFRFSVDLYKAIKQNTSGTAVPTSDGDATTARPSSEMLAKVNSTSTTAKPSI